MHRIKIASNIRSAVQVIHRIRLTVVTRSSLINGVLVAQHDNESGRAKCHYTNSDMHR